MKSYYIKYLSADEKELLSEVVDLETLKDYDELICFSSNLEEEKERDIIES